MKFSHRVQANYRVLTQDPRLYTMQKLARFEIVRNVARHISRPFTSSDKSRREASSIFEKIDIDFIISRLEADGCFLGINLPPFILEGLLNYANNNAFYGNRDPKLRCYYNEKKQLEAQVGEEFYIGSYLNDSEACPFVQKLRNDPGLLAIAAKFLETPDPVYVGSELLWSFPTETKIEMLQRRAASQLLHYDLDDYRFIKFFFYLTDVTLENGPHVCLRGSHRNKKFIHQMLVGILPYKEEENIITYYGAENLLTICEKAGFGFIEDPYCFHKAIPPQNKERLVLQIQFNANYYWGLRQEGIGLKRRGLPT